MAEAICLPEVIVACSHCFDGIDTCIIMTLCVIYLIMTIIMMPDNNCHIAGVDDVIN